MFFFFFCVVSDTLDEHTVSIFSPHDVTTHKNNIDIFTFVLASDLTTKVHYQFFLNVPSLSHNEKVTGCIHNSELIMNRNRPDVLIVNCLIGRTGKQGSHSAAWELCNKGVESQNSLVSEYNAQLNKFWFLAECLLRHTVSGSERARELISQSGTWFLSKSQWVHQSLPKYLLIQSINVFSESVNYLWVVDLVLATFFRFKWHGATLHEWQSLNLEICCCFPVPVPLSQLTPAPITTLFLLTKTTALVIICAVK